MKIGATETTVRDLDVDIAFFPNFGLKLAPFHFAIDGIRRFAKPAFKLVRSCHFEVVEKWMLLLN
jgi:hypothetical protein